MLLSTWIESLRSRMCWSSRSASWMNRRRRRFCGVLCSHIEPLERRTLLSGIAPTADAGPMLPSLNYSVEPTPSGGLWLDGSASFDLDGVISAYEWDLNNDGDFTDAIDQTGVGPTVLWSTLEAAGWAANTSYTITLRVTDDEGLTDTDTAGVEVGNGIPTADAGGDYNVIYGADLSLDGTGSSDPDGDPLTYRWDVDGDTSAWELTGPTATPTWSTLLITYGMSPGNSYIITLEVDDGNGGTDQDSAMLTLLRPQVSIVATDATAREGYAPDITADKGKVLISRTQTVLLDPLIVNLTAPAGTATAGTDYTTNPDITGASVTIPAGAGFVLVDVDPMQDENFLEGNETAVFTIAPGAIYTIAAGAGSATVTIEDVNRSPNVDDDSLTITRNRTGLITNVDATDPDTGQTLSYSLSGSSVFWIIGSGILAVQEPSVLQDLTETKIYELTVTVTDNGTPNISDTGVYTITVLAQDLDVTLTEVKFLEDHTVYKDPPDFIFPTYSSIWTPSIAMELLFPTVVAYSSGLGSANKRLKVNAVFEVDNEWTGTAQFKAKTTGGYEFTTIPATHDEAHPTNYDLLNVSGATATTNFNVGAEYFEDFRITWEITIDGGTTWINVGESENPLYVTWKDPAATLYRTVLHIGSTNAAGVLAEPNVINAIWGEFSDRSVKRWHDDDGDSALQYNHDGDTALTAKDMLEQTDGKGQCTAWADLFVQVLGAQGVTGATSTRIDPTGGYGRFRVKLMLAQGSGAANYTVTDFGFHQVVRVSGFPDTIFDPSYGTMVEKTDARSVELKYEDEVVTHFQLPNLTWVADTKGVQQLVFTP